MRVLDGEGKEPGRDRFNEDEGPFLVRCSYMRAGETVLEQSEFIDRNLTITELVEQARRFEDLGIELVGVRINLVSGPDERTRQRQVIDRAEPGSMI